MTGRHKWSVEDDKAALEAYLEKSSRAGARKIAERLGIPADSFWMRICNFQYLATGIKGYKNYAAQSRLVWEGYRNQALAKSKDKVEPGIPTAVVDLAMDNEWSAARAWCEYKELTQTEVAQRMGMTQGAYAQLEGRKTLRKKIAKALDIHESQLDF